MARDRSEGIAMNDVWIISGGGGRSPFMEERRRRQMKIDRNYHQALIQVANAVRDGCDQLCEASAMMIAGKPGEAADSLLEAKRAVESAMTAAKWATTLSTEEE